MTPAHLREIIAGISIRTTKELNGQVEGELLEAFVLAGKYFLLACLPREMRRNINNVANPRSCPLCLLHLRDECKDCVLAEPPYAGCGDDYRILKTLVETAPSMDAFMSLSLPVKALLRKAITRLHVAESDSDEGTYRDHHEVHRSTSITRDGRSDHNGYIEHDRECSCQGDRGEGREDRNLHLEREGMDSFQAELDFEGKIQDN